MRHRFFLLFTLCSGLFFGCASPHLYEWSDYDQWLYKNYKHPENDEKLYTHLQYFIEGYEQKKNPKTKPMAPGIYAEYGFLLMRRGETKRAIDAFNKEKALWPEATVFMDHMIETAQIAQKGKLK